LADDGNIEYLSVVPISCLIQESKVPQLSLGKFNACLICVETVTAGKEGIDNSQG
jgi:hypothetical protein